jgi:NADPH:quinone reductase-like Zn-dependent oxidoreductase
MFCRGLSITKIKLMSNTTMKAAICPQYGPPDVLRISDVPKPIPQKGEILVKVMASAVNSGDVRVRGLAVTGLMKALMLVVLGWSRPRKPILGTVFAGIVEDTGSEVTAFKPGDEVFGLTGFRFGGHAQYLTTPSQAPVVLKPKKATWEEAAAIPFGGQTAIHFLEKSGIPHKKQPSVLIYGASGSVGTAAVQLARHYGARVTAVCGEQGKDLVASLGAERIIVYTREDFTKDTDTYDLVFDAVGKITLNQCRHLLKPDGVFKTVGGWETASESKAQLELLAGLFDAGQYQATIDRVYTLDDIVEAHRYADSGRKKGNVVIRIAPLW